MEIITNHKGEKKLIHEGYMYTKKYAGKTIRWECSNRTAFSCKGGVSTDSDIITVTSFRPHSHHPQDQAVAITKLRATWKDHAAGSRGTVTQLIADHTTYAPFDVRAGLGNPDTVKRSLRRECAKRMPKNPASLNDLTLDTEWTTTVDGEEFLVYDNGVDSSDRMLVFGTESGLRHLARSDTWFMDGTFDVAPMLFSQLYIIRAPLGKTAVTCVYAFLPNKQQETYVLFRIYAMNLVLMLTHLL